MSRNASWTPDLDCARSLDEADDLAPFRDEFHIPLVDHHHSLAYFCGHSLGLQPKQTATWVQEELRAWQELAVEAHFEGKRPWYSYHEQARDPLSRLVGGLPSEVVAMNSLTTNLHLMLVSFYQPTRDRYKILIDAPVFPSDRYAVASHLAYHGHDHHDGLIVLGADSTNEPISQETLEQCFSTFGEQVALVLFSGVNFFNGQRFDLEALTTLAHRYGCTVGIDLAHAIGNVPLSLHTWNVDFAVWCSYKYLNSGPGAVGGCFVHERHGHEWDRPRFAGWWGNDPETRFRMQLNEQFIPYRGADGWQLSNPPILAFAPLLASLDLFDRATMRRLRSKSEQLTAYLEFLLTPLIPKHLQLITPREVDARGAQLSLQLSGSAEPLFHHLRQYQLLGDLRPPNVIRVAPVPLYNRFEEVWRLAQACLEFFR